MNYESYTEIDWLKHFNRDFILVQAHKKLGSRAYLTWDQDERSAQVEVVGSSTFNIYLDKLPSTPEGAKLYIFQSFTELSRSLYNDGQALAHEYRRYDFDWAAGHPKVGAKLEALKLVLKAMDINHFYFGHALRNIESGSEYDIHAHPWMSRFYDLVFSWYAVILKDIELPDGMKFWK